MSYYHFHCQHGFRLDWVALLAQLAGVLVPWIVIRQLHLSSVSKPKLKSIKVIDGDAEGTAAAGRG